MAFTYNSHKVFQFLEAEGRLDEILEQWFNLIDNGEFTLAYELRRNIFGLSAIIKTPEEQIPQKVFEQLP